MDETTSSGQGGAARRFLGEGAVLDEASSRLADALASTRGRRRSVWRRWVQLRKRGGRRRRERRSRHRWCWGRCRQRCGWWCHVGGWQGRPRRRKFRERNRQPDAAARSGGHGRWRRVARLGCWRLDSGGWQLRHLLRLNVVKDLDRAKVNACTLRQMATPIYLHNIVIMGP